LRVPFDVAAEIAIEVFYVRPVNVDLVVLFHCKPKEWDAFLFICQFATTYIYPIFDTAFLFSFTEEAFLGSRAYFNEILFSIFLYHHVFHTYMHEILELPVIDFKGVCNQ
jgi:hypothetical protein